MNPVRRLVRDTLRDRRRLAITAAIVAVMAGAGLVAYTLLRPAERGVLPLWSQDFVQGEVLVKFMPGTQVADQLAFHAATRTDVVLNHRGALDKLGVAHLRIPAGLSVGETVQIYSRNPNVEFAEPNYLRQAIDAPNDTYFGNQWNLAKLMVARAWDVTKGSESVRIAVLDTGVDAAHEEMAGRVAGSPVADDNGHGTQVAGILAAATGNAKGVAGICPLCTLDSHKVLSATGSGSDAGIAAAIVAATDAGDRVINLSLGSYATTRTMQQAIDYAWNHNVVVVAAAGNDNTNRMFYPAALKNVVAVGASTSADAKSAISNHGDWVAMWAPGQNIIAPKMGGGYGAVAGTSFAAPHVAGLAGLMISANPQLTNRQVVDLILDNADATEAGRRANGCRAIRAASGASGLICGEEGSGNSVASNVPAPSPSPTATTRLTTLSPVLQAPPPGARLHGFGASLGWTNGPGVTQVHLQVLPFEGDGPSIDLIRDPADSFVIPAPPAWYGLLPDMTYTWRVRTATVPTRAGEGDWSPWASTTFRTPPAGSVTITPVAPTPGNTVAGLTPQLRWANSQAGVFYYEVQLSKDATFVTDAARATAMVYGALVHGGVTDPPNTYTVSARSPLEPATDYYWRVRPRIQGDGTPTAWTPAFPFRTP